MREDIKHKIISFPKLLMVTLISLFFINGIVYILDNKLGLLNPVHSIVLRNISSALESKQSSYLPTSDSAVVLVSNKMFETYSNYQAPFNKDVMTLLVQKIAKQNPKALVFDFDISPYYDFKTPRNDYLNYPLYKEIKKISKNIPVVVPFVFMGETNENNMLKLFWFRNMCQSKVHFATPLLTSEIGIVLQYSDYSKQLNILTDKLLKNNSEESLCQKIENLNDFNLSKIKQEIKTEYQTAKQLPINYQAINTSTITIDTPEDIDKYDLKNKTIYLGSGYGFNDLFVTPYGEKYGVEIHNAILYSLNNKISNANVALSILMDILIGFSFGILLSWTLAKRKQLTTTNMLIINNLSIIFIVAFFILLSTYLSAILFHTLFIWLNPIPIIIGMFIDMIIDIDNKKFNDSLKTNWLKSGGKFIFVLIGILSALALI